METGGDKHLVVSITFAERHLILMVITGESLQNLQNIVNVVDIKVDCQSGWKSDSPPLGVFLLAENHGFGLQMIRSFELCWNAREGVY